MLVINVSLKRWFATFEMLRYIFQDSRNVNSQHFLPGDWVAVYVS